MSLEFQKPAAKHSQSFFAALPDELKLTILRHLLVAPRRITPLRDGYPRANQTSSTTWGYNLCPQILRTCQYIHKIGNPILYDENRLELWLRDGSWSTSSGVFCLSEFHRFGLMPRQKCDFSKMVSILKLMRRFRGLQLTVIPYFNQLTYLEGIFKFLKGSGVAWQEKDLIVFVKDCQHYHQYGHIEAAEVKALVRVVGFLRCKQTRFEGVPCESYALSISKLRMDESMPNLLRMYINLEREILTERNTLKRQWASLYLLNLWEAVKNWDVEAFGQGEGLIKAHLSKAAIARYLQSNAIQEGRKFYDLRGVTNNTHGYDPYTSTSHGLTACGIPEWEAKAMCAASDFHKVPCDSEPGP